MLFCELAMVAVVIDAGSMDEFDIEVERGAVEHDFTADDMTPRRLDDELGYVWINS